MAAKAAIHASLIEVKVIFPPGTPIEAGTMRPLIVGGRLCGRDDVEGRSDICSMSSDRRPEYSQ